MRFSTKRIIIFLAVAIFAVVSVSAQVGARTGGFILLACASQQGGNENSYLQNNPGLFSINGQGNEYEYGYDGIQFEIPVSNGSFVKIIGTSESKVSAGVMRYSTSAYIESNGNQINGYIVTKQTGDPTILDVYFVCSWGVFWFRYKETI